MLPEEFAESLALWIAEGYPKLLVEYLESKISQFFAENTIQKTNLPICYAYHTVSHCYSRSIGHYHFVSGEEKNPQVSRGFEKCHFRQGKKAIDIENRKM